MSVWGVWELEVIREIAVMEDWAPAGLQQVLAPPPPHVRLQLILYDFMEIPGEVQSVGWGVGSGKAWNSHYFLTTTEVSQCFNSSHTLTLPAPAG